MEELYITFGNHKTKLTLEKQLGKGAFGTVHLANDDRGCSFAVKRSDCIDNDTYVTSTQEIAMLLNVQHENIARMYAFDFQNKIAIVIMEYCSGGDLNERLEIDVKFSEQMIWISQLLGAISYLHQNNIAHRDLKPENVLLSHENDIKVTDFGISRYYYTNKDCAKNNLSEYRQAYMGTFAGTPYWVAPEVFDENYTLKADLFSLGVIIHAILHQKFIPHQGKNYYGAFVDYHGRQLGLGLAMFEQNIEISPVEKFDKNEKMDEIVNGLLRKNPDDRISLKEAIGILGDESHFIDIVEEEEVKKEKEIKEKQYFSSIWKMRLGRLKSSSKT